MLASAACGGSQSGGDETSTEEEPIAKCGDGVVEGDEECDDANSSEDDACLSDCTKPGGTLWTHTFDATTYYGSRRVDVAATSDGIYAVLPAGDTGVEVRRLDLEGNEEWRLVSDSLTCERCDVVATPNGNAVIAGVVGNESSRVVSITATEETAWTQDVGWTLVDVVLDVDLSGNVIVGHDESFEGALSRFTEDGQPAGSVVVSGVDWIQGVAALAGGGYLALSDPGIGWTLVAVSPEFQLAWVHDFEEEPVNPAWIASDGRGGAIMGAYIEGDAPSGLFRFDLNGDFDYQAPVDWPGAANVHELASDADGNLYVVGIGGAGITELFYAKLDRNAAHQWSQIWSGETATAISLGNGAGYVGGWIEDEVGFVRAVEL